MANFARARQLHPRQPGRKQRIGPHATGALGEIKEYAPNGTLRQRFLNGTRLPVATILPYVRQVAEALVYAHQRRLIHRDVKPENMLLGSNMDVLLSDFGIALITQTTQQADKPMEGISRRALFTGLACVAIGSGILGVLVYEHFQSSGPPRQSQHKLLPHLRPRTLRRLPLPPMPLRLLPHKVTRLQFTWVKVTR